MRRGFTLLEVLLAVALVGTGVILMLAVRSRCIDEAGAAQHVRMTRLLLDARAGEAVARGLPLGTQGGEAGDDFPELVVEAAVDEVALDDLLPEDLLALPAGPQGPGEGPPGPGGAGGSAGAKEKPLMLRRLQLTVGVPGAPEDPAAKSVLVTLRLPPPEEKPAGTPKPPAQDDEPSLIGPDAPGPGAPPGQQPTGGPPPPGGNPPPPPGPGGG